MLGLSNLVLRAFSLTWGRDRKRSWHRLVTCPLAFNRCNFPLLCLKSLQARCLNIYWEEKVLLAFYPLGLANLCYFSFFWISCLSRRTITLCKMRLTGLFYTTSTVCGIYTFAVFWSVTRPFCPFTRVCGSGGWDALNLPRQSTHKDTIRLQHISTGQYAKTITSIERTR